MLGAAVAILFWLLPSQVNGLISTDAKCLSGYEWMSSSIGQSPCDVAAELASVCIARPFNLSPLPTGYIYSGPTVANQNSCRCSSVYYSLLSGCSYCQGRNYRRWSVYVTNCSAVHLKVYTEQIPVGVKVPAYAYQDVSVADSFNVTLAYSIRGVESSRSSASTQIRTPTSSQPPDSSISATSDGSSSGSADTSPQIVVNARNNNTPAIVGGVVGGVVGLGLIGTLFTFLILHSKRNQKSENTTGFQQQSPNMAFSPNTTASFIQSTSPPPGSPGLVYNPNDQNTYPFADPSGYDPYRQHSPPLISNNFTGSTTHNNVSAQTMPGISQYTGRPEV